MKKLFVIEDDVHADIFGEYDTYDSALIELKKLSNIPWDQKPNKCPCEEWQTCGREYMIVEYDVLDDQWTKIKETLILKISADGVEWVN